MYCVCGCFVLLSYYFVMCVCGWFDLLLFCVMVRVVLSGVALWYTDLLCVVLCLLVLFCFVLCCCVCV